ncbi:thiomuracin/GE37468 family thiazolyl RiPP peptide [Nonomuraea typhae]|uniref:Thiomuracin/GE37468 family thiazolyl RiPP peptide n=1 Tax=Nonomuraea typhae TaxID=2603600 RepID=A0ABW7YTE8_9ACTN
MRSLSLDDLTVEGVEFAETPGGVSLETLTTGHGMTEIGASCAICGSSSCSSCS